jgi:hypothetical protein
MKDVCFLSGDVFMSSVWISLIVFMCIVGGAICGMLLRKALPPHHIGGESKEAVMLGMGLLGTMTALILGLLVASAKSAYDAQNAELTQLSANIVFLDRELAHYGTETKDARDLLRRGVVRALDGLWSVDSEPSHLDTSATHSEALYDAVQQLSPKDDVQRWLKGQALSTAISIGQTRWLMYEQSRTTVSMPLLVTLVFWLTISFTTFGLFTPVNATAITSIFVSALSVSIAIVLIVEMYTPYKGLIHLSGAPLRAALAHLGQ